MLALCGIKCAFGCIFRRCSRFYLFAPPPSRADIDDGQHGARRRGRAGGQLEAHLDQLWQGASHAGENLMNVYDTCTRTIWVASGCAATVVCVCVFRFESFHFVLFPLRVNVMTCFYSSRQNLIRRH